MKDRILCKKSCEKMGAVVDYYTEYSTNQQLHLVANLAATSGSGLTSGRLQALLLLECNGHY